MRISCFVSSVVVASLAAQSQPSPHIRIDAFGYRPTMQKVAVLREPRLGFDAPLPYTPGPVIEVRRVHDASVAFAAAPTSWRGGAVHAQSGDAAWWFDFSALREVGSYYVFDPSRGSASEHFEIADDVYRDALVAAVRAFFYQRCGAPKASPHAHANWQDAIACHVGASQDRACRFVSAPGDATRARDLSGGWHDAGDFNKYVNFADDAVHDLLMAYATAPTFWTDDFGIPESGNGVPDLLDEVRYELDWLLRMQNPDGSVLHKVSVTDFAVASPPSADTAPRRYAPATASATVSAAGVFAHAANVFGSLSDAASQNYAARLESAAVAAWRWLDRNPQSIPSAYDNAGFASVAAEDDAYWQAANRVRAAAHLFRRTGAVEYRSYFDARFRDLHVFAWSWAAGWEAPLHDALLVYLSSPGATLSVVDAIRAQLEQTITNSAALADVQADADAYRAPIGASEYVWGNNRYKAHTGSMFTAMNRHGLAPARVRQFRDAAAGYLHYLHGVNPIGLAQLTNMSAAGAQQSMRTMYHGWFADGTVWDDVRTGFGPAPGYVIGGPNSFFAPDAAYVGPPLVPPMNQPPQKSLREWNTSWPENSWQITEPHIPYQAAYVRLLAAFAVGPLHDLGLRAPAELAPSSVARFAIGGAAPGSVVALFAAFGDGRAAFSSPSLCLDLGLDLTLPLADHLLLLGICDGNGEASWSLPLPATFPRITTLRYQAVTPAGACPHVIHSAVLP